MNGTNWNQKRTVAATMIVQLYTIKCNLPYSLVLSHINKMGYGLSLLSSNVAKKTDDSQNFSYVN